MPDRTTDGPSSPIVYLALSILCSNQNSLVPELLYVLNAEQIINFIKVFGGETLKIPTASEFGKDMMAAIACYHIDVEDKSWDFVAMKYNIDGNYLRALKNRLEAWSSTLTQSEREFLESLRHYERVRKKEEELVDEKVIEWL